VRRLLVLPAVLLLTTAAACTDAPAPSVSGTVDNTAMVLANAVEPTSLNPVRGYAPDGMGKIFDGLVEYQADRTPHDVLAAAPPVPAADGRSWTVSIARDVKFSDGTPLTAADVAATYQAVINPAVNSPLRPDYDMLAAAVPVDEHTVRFDLGFAYPSFPNRLVLGIIKHTAAPTDPQPVGTGPYQLVSWTKGSQLVLRANKSYFGTAPKVTKLTVRFVPDDTTRADKTRADSFDGAEVSPRQAVAFAKVDGVKVITEDTADYRAVTLPTGNPVTGDKAVRLALNFALDRKDLIGTALAGKGTPAYTPMPDSLPEFVDPRATYRLDRTEAGRILDQAGWVLGPDGVRAKGGVRAAFTVGYPATDSEREAVAQAVAKQLKLVGFDVTASADAPAGSPQVVAGGNPFDPDLALRPVLHTGGAQNTGGYSDPNVDAALDNAHHATDPAQRAAAFRQAQRAYISDPGLVVLTTVTHTYAIHDDWSGAVPITEPAAHGALTWGPWWNLETWTVR
jgi:peptide/nickel transport system substrate-binding protein